MTVTDAVTAIAVGSGDMPVLATPMMIALMENAAMLAVKNKLPEGCTTVGGHIESSYLKLSKMPSRLNITRLCGADCSSSFFFPFSLEAGSYHLLTQFMNMGEDFTFPLSRRLLETIDIVTQ